jgi:acyl-CoA oxidase
MGDTLEHLFSTALFEPRQRHHLPLRTYMDLNIQRMHAIFSAGILNNDFWLGQPQSSRFTELCERMGWLSAFDFALVSSVVDHMIAVDALLNHASPHQLGRYRDEAIRMRKVYAFACTEVAVGTDVRNVQTRVTYDRQHHRLILHSPSPEACKCWIGNALHAAQVLMVLARLEVDGEDQGHHWFRVVVRKRENGRLLPGVRMIACDPKGGIHANQVAAIRFCNVSLPVEALLQRHAHFTRDGVFISDLPKQERFINALGTFLQERMLFLSSMYQSASLASHLSYRFAQHRRVQASGSLATLLDNPLVCQRLYAIQLRAVALKYLEQSIRRQFESAWAKPTQRKNLHALAALAKSFGAWVSLEVIGLSRELCGSQGFHHYNQIVTQRMDCEVANTFAGDSSVMAYQVMKNALNRPRFVGSEPANAAQRIEAKIIKQCRRKGDFCHGEAIGVTYARALDQIIQEVEAGSLLDAQTLTDLAHVFAPQLHPWGLTGRSIDSQCANQGRIEHLASLLKPPQFLISAPIDSPDYVQGFTHALYEEP